MDQTSPAQNGIQRRFQHRVDTSLPGVSDTVHACTVHACHRFGAMTPQYSSVTLTATPPWRCCTPPCALPRSCAGTAASSTALGGTRRTSAWWAAAPRGRRGSDTCDSTDTDGLVGTAHAVRYTSHPENSSSECLLIKAGNAAALVRCPAVKDGVGIELRLRAKLGEDDQSSDARGRPASDGRVPQPQLLQVWCRGRWQRFDVGVHPVHHAVHLYEQDRADGVCVDRRP